MSLTSLNRIEFLNLASPLSLRRVQSTSSTSTPVFAFKANQLLRPHRKPINFYDLAETNQLPQTSPKRNKFLDLDLIFASRLCVQNESASSSSPQVSAFETSQLPQPRPRQNESTSSILSNPQPHRNNSTSTISTSPPIFEFGKPNHLRTPEPLSARLAVASRLWPEKLRAVIVIRPVKTSLAAVGETNRLRTLNRLSASLALAVLCAFLSVCQRSCEQRSWSGPSRLLWQHSAQPLTSDNQHSPSGIFITLLCPADCV
ncbi:hypothetical protein JOL62DRAFT_328176 [Phyllosticta paracitricarpa]|uniref:Uncharacterized protein n=1 Tax=Phyllosticta paracitricarpa TaxID=2016321 RepID=A0ABR1MUI1_9PEZI